MEPREFWKLGTKILKLRYGKSRKGRRRFVRESLTVTPPYIELIIVLILLPVIIPCIIYVALRWVKSKLLRLCVKDMSQEDIILMRHDYLKDQG